MNTSTSLWLRQHEKNSCFAIALGSVGNHYGIWSLSSQEIESQVDRYGYGNSPIGWGEAEKLIQGALGQKLCLSEVLRHTSPDCNRPLADAVAELHQHVSRGYAAILSFKEVGAENFHAFTIHRVGDHGRYEVWDNLGSIALRGTDFAGGFVCSSGRSWELHPQLDWRFYLPAKKGVANNAGEVNPLA